MISRNHTFEYNIIRSRRKTLSITISGDGEVIVKAPLRMLLQDVQQFVESKEHWILSRQQEVLRKKENHAEEKKLTADMRAPDGQTYREQARQAIIPRVNYFAERMELRPNSIRIKEQKSRWGSCSSKRNLNFNWRLVLMPQEVMDYVVVHELCHLRYMNHSQEFWAYVEQIMPDYRRWKKWLKEY
ncbi:M48 family metallopeptidase [Hespellia stercorisuis]|uniref:YgjP-like metallopeptidase domain-containing protein n=1 Tax=Hespellia stercorisuis DSM 15480 TaxID=1121950 RepID=A0A1M6U8I0_9FIRM|nr:SprT family zinc-dependent metalloprotease [Hespellia stercorisuis]SHK65460.1 hypothetical protein SAMN02745243_03435 [Hespellia stercorisuis DSM 15480]